MRLFALSLDNDELTYLPTADIDMHADFLRLRGKTYDYRIAYSQVQKLFLLPKPDDIHCQFVVRSAARPSPSAPKLTFLCHTGQHRPTNSSGTDSLPLPRHAVCQGRDHGARPQPGRVRRSSPPFRNRTDLSAITGRRSRRSTRTISSSATTTLPTKSFRSSSECSQRRRSPHPATFSRASKSRPSIHTPLTSHPHSHDGYSAVKCNLKANEGQLYFLEKQLLFISKQPTLVPHSDISAVIFARSVV